MNYAILLAGGTGQRIHSEIPKQYVRVGDKMMVTYALETLLRSPRVDTVCVVADPSWRDEIRQDVDGLVDAGKLRGFADPGENRQCSIWNALKKIQEYGDGDTVLIHDAARPFLTMELLESCYQALSGHDGVMPVLPMKDTVYRSRDGRKVAELIDRSEIFAGQAPELFMLRPYAEAVRSLIPDRILKVNGSSEPAVMVGMDIAMIPGDERNVKVTTDADLERFRKGLGS